LAAQGFDVWNLELRGHGRSRSEEQLGAECFADYVDDVVRVSESLPDRSFWMGHSLGGTALYAAATRTDSRGLVTIAAPYRFGRVNKLTRLLCAATHASPFVMGNLQVRTQLIGKVVARAHAMADVAGYTLPLSGWWPGSVEPDLVEERLVRGFDWTSVTVWKEMSRWSVTDRFEYDQAWSETDVPVFVLLGDMDQMLPAEEGRVAYERSGSSDRTIEILDDWKHQVHWGHLDLVLGRYAPAHVWSMTRDWMVARCRS
jgi:pimeloyl-ACP methyl ester carboxylesterase